MIAELFNNAFDFTLRNVFYFFWLPVMFDLFGYSLVNWNEYKEDVEKRDKSERFRAEGNIYSYHPSLKLGHLVGRYIVCFLPVINLLVAVFKFVPRIVADLIHACEKWLDIPLVPAKE